MPPTVGGFLVSFFNVTYEIIVFSHLVS